MRVMQTTKKSGILGWNVLYSTPTPHAPDTHTRLLPCDFIQVPSEGPADGIRICADAQPPLPAPPLVFSVLTPSYITQFQKTI